MSEEPYCYEKMVWPESSGCEALQEAQTKLQSLEAKLAMATSFLAEYRNMDYWDHGEFCHPDIDFDKKVDAAISPTPEDIKAFIQKVKDEAVRECIRVAKQEKWKIEQELSKVPPHAQAFPAQKLLAANDVIDALESLTPNKEEIDHR